jgi:16S rRNA (guanine966-N2)-methyltransferase
VLAAEGLRPTPDRVRETLFNWLAPYINGACCLDLFAGTGALCLEALSRGAAEVVMVERDAAAVRQLRENVARLEALGAQVVASDALEYLAGRASTFDIVFLDPPFAVAEDMIPRCAERLAEGWLKPGGLLYIEAPRALKTMLLPDDWQILKSQTAGPIAYSLARA